MIKEHQRQIIVKVALNESWVGDSVDHLPVLVPQHLILLLCVPLPTPHYHSAGLYRAHTVPSSQNYPSRYQATPALVLSDQLCSSIWGGNLTLLQYGGAELITEYKCGQCQVIQCNTTIMFNKK